MTHIEINAGTVTSSVTETAGKRHHNITEIGTFRFFVDVVEPDGRTGLWDGTDYGEAIVVAHDLATSWDDEVGTLEVHDLVVC